MRLIDADALINDIEELITEHEEMMRDGEEHPENYPEDYKTRVLNLIAGLITAKVEVANAPTIISTGNIHFLHRTNQKGGDTE